MSEKEYERFRGVLKVIYTTSLATALTGLSGLVTSTALTRFGSPEYAKIGNKLMTPSIMLTFSAGYLAAHFGMNYYANPPLDKNIVEY